MKSAAFAATLALFVATALVSAAPKLTSSVMDGGGGRSSGGSLSLVSAVGQPGGVQTSKKGPVVLQAGFLNTFSLKPALDTDGDGLPNEVDSDNDGDGIVDEDELAGVAFVPVTVTDLNDPDSDGDGAKDGAEAAAGTNPLDPNMFLHITSIDSEAGDSVVITWRAQAGKRYTVYALNSLSDPRPGTRVGLDVTATGGTGPWYSVVVDKTDATPPAKRFYYVKVVQ